MRVLDDGRIECRVRIRGTFRGEPFEYVDPDGQDVDGDEQHGSQFIWPAGVVSDIENGPDPSTWWWSEGNMGCDCNRDYLLPEHMRKLLPKRSNSPDEDGCLCGHEILIDSIEPVECGPNGERLPSLFLNETSQGHS